jgi:hypothetical protein
MNEISLHCSILPNIIWHLSILEQVATAVKLLSGALYVSPHRQQAIVDAGDVNPAPWKKAKQDLLLKHMTSAPTREIQQFKCLSLAPDDVWSW